MKSKVSTNDTPKASHMFSRGPVSNGSINVSGQLNSDTNDSMAEGSILDLEPLNDFLGKATLATYAGGGKRIKTEKKGFIDLEHQEGDFYYHDSFAGYLASHGQETVWFQDKPVWMCSYAGGMRGSKTDDAAFANETFDFLKQAMRSREKSKAFRARGPKKLKDGDWEYKNDCKGDISNFKGHEEIHYKGEKIFEHDYFGGILKDGRK